MTETQVGKLLERATADLRPSADLVAGGVAVGRRRRRRSLVVASAGTLAATAVAGALVSLQADGTGGDDSVVADDSPSVAVSVATAASTTPPPLGDPTFHGPFPLPEDAMASTLASLLDGTVTNPQSSNQHPAAPDGSQSGSVDLNGAAVTVAFQHSTAGRCDGDQGLKTCTPLGDGFLGTYAVKIYDKGDGYTGAHGTGVTVYTPEGYKISVTAMNAGSADPTVPVMDDPALGQAALVAIAMDPAWR